MSDPKHDDRPDTMKPETYLPRVDPPAHDARPFLVPKPTEETAEVPEVEPQPVESVTEEEPSDAS